MRYFLIDRVTEISPGDFARGVKCVTLSEDVLHDHFPDLPLLPGAFVIEAMAQLGGFLLEMSTNSRDSIRRALLVQVDNAKFHKAAEPGDLLELTARMAEQMEDAAKVDVTVTVSGEKSASAKLTFVLKSIDSERIHEQRRYLYKLWTKNLKQSLQIL